MRLHRLLLCALVAAPALVSAQDPAGTKTAAPSGFTFTSSLGSGGELGLDSKYAKGKSGVFELELLAGYDLEAIALRPELGLVVGLAPDSNLALRPGVRWQLAGLPIQLRAALDASDARDTSWRWRWLLVGAATEIRVTSLLGLFAEADTGIPLSRTSGLPLLLRGGASFRF
jgi:hypothetical protein